MARARLPGLPVTGVPPAPPAVLAQRDAFRVVALGLVGLVVAPLALLAGEGDTDAHISTGHENRAPSDRLRQEHDQPGGRAKQDVTRVPLGERLESTTL